MALGCRECRHVHLTHGSIEFRNGDGRPMTTSNSQIRQGRWVARPRYKRRSIFTSKRLDEIGREVEKDRTKKAAVCRCITGPFPVDQSHSECTQEGLSTSVQDMIESKRQIDSFPPGRTLNPSEHHQQSNSSCLHRGCSNQSGIRNGLKV